MAWKNLEITAPDINPAPLTGIVDAMRTLLETLVGILEGILTFVSVGVDPFAAALKALIDKLKAAIESYLEDLGGYSLFVPVRKRLQTNFLGLGDITPSWAGELGIFGESSSSVSPQDPDLNQFLADANRYNGGNAGFFKTVIESLYDEGDTGRPQFFDEDDYVGGFVLVMGTDFDPLGFLDDCWRLAGLFDGPNLIPKVPRPTGLQARTIQGISDGTFSTLLTWDLPDAPLWTLSDLGGTVLIPDRYAIMRGRNTTAALSAESVVDLMGKRDLGEGDTFSNGNLEVVLEDSYDITIGSHLDESISGSSDDTFYYVVAWKLKALRENEANTEEAGQLLDYWYISNVARVTPYPTLPASTPPDWFRTPSIASIFPEFAALLRKLVAQIDGFSSKLLGATDTLKAYVSFLNAEIERYEELVSDILDDITKLKQKFTGPTAGLYLRSFKGKGGNDFFISDLASSFLPRESNRPPFTKGDEYVTGAIVMAGGSEIAVDSLLAGLSWIFGAPDSKDDAMGEMLEELNATVSSMEDTQFGKDMKSPVETVAATSTIAFGPDMSEISFKTEETPQFGKDMKVT